MAHGSTDTDIEAQSGPMDSASVSPDARPGALYLALAGVFAPLGALLARLRDLAAASPESLGQVRDERPYLDTIAFREVLPVLEERHLLLGEIKELSRRTEDTDPERLAALQRQHEESLPEFLETLEKSTMCVHSRCHHDIRDMLENVVLFDNFINDFYLRNICNTMKDAIEKAAREV